MGDESDKSKYASLADDIDEFRYSSGAGAKTLAGAKIFAKGFFNLGVFAITEAIPKIVEEQKKSIDKLKK